MTEFIKGQGAVPAIQLQHAGRKGSTYRAWSGEGTVSLDDGGWNTVGPSAIAFPGYDAPVALDEQGIADVVAAFGKAARLALDAGFEVVEIHGAHGYLIHQFLSPVSNQRTDDWGGSLENRARLLLDVVREVRRRVGEEVPVFVRVSATDWLEPEGLTLDESVTVAGWVREAGGDVMDVSTGGNVTGATIPVGPGYQVPHASAIKSGAQHRHGRGRHDHVGRPGRVDRRIGQGRRGLRGPPVHARPAPARCAGLTRSASRSSFPSSTPAGRGPRTRRSSLASSRLATQTRFSPTRSAST